MDWIMSIIAYESTKIYMKAMKYGIFLKAIFKNSNEFSVQGSDRKDGQNLFFKSTSRSGQYDALAVMFFVAARCRCYTGIREF